MLQTKLVKIAEKNAVQPGETIRVDVDGQEIALFNVVGKLYAVQAACTHKGGPLHEGTLNGKTVTCPWHQTDFDVTTGKVLKIPFPPQYGTATDLKSYQVVEQEDGIYVSLR